MDPKAWAGIPEGIAQEVPSPSPGSCERRGNHRKPSKARSYSTEDFGAGVFPEKKPPLSGWSPGSLEFPGAQETED